MTFVTPGIHHEKNEDYKPEDEQNERTGPVLPELLEAVCNVIRLHAAVNLHPCSEFRNLEIRGREPTDLR
jgi:hypothetical protein